VPFVGVATPRYIFIETTIIHLPTVVVHTDDSQTAVGRYAQNSRYAVAMPKIDLCD